MRKRRAEIRTVLPDPVYNDVVISKLINNLMLDGKKGRAEKIVYNAFKIIEETTKEKPEDVFLRALENIKPALEVKSRRVGGSNLQVPVEVRAARGQTLGLRWLINYARLRPGRDMTTKLAKEIIDASNGTGASVKKKEDTHRMAEANKAFAHYRW